MKKLPNIFKPNIEHSINNNSDVYYSFVNEPEKKVTKATNSKSFRSSTQIIKQLNTDAIFNKKVLIKTADNMEQQTEILSKMGNNIIISNGKVISIYDIISIKVI